jgi:RNA polymerase sigma-70 factor, ECF subfamily
MKEVVPGTDSFLIAEFLGGDTTAFERLINPYRRRLYTYLCRMVGDPETAKDLFQDVALNVLKGLPNYREEQKFSGWMFSIAHNAAMNHIQKKKHQPETMMDKSYCEIMDSPADDSWNPDERLKHRDMKEILKSSIERLPVEQREILLLRETNEMPFREIAEMLGCPLNTVLGRMRYALHNLRRIIQREYGEELYDVL